MKSCKNCHKQLHFWNKYHRQYPAIEVKNSNIKHIYFCSAKCVFKYMDKVRKQERKRK